MCCPFLGGRQKGNKETHKKKIPRNLRKMPGQSRDIPVNCLFMCFLVYWLFPALRLKWGHKTWFCALTRSAKRPEQPLPKGPKIEKFQDLEFIKRDWKFQASHAPKPYFLWEILRVRDWKFQSGLKISSEIYFFQSLGPQGFSRSRFRVDFGRFWPQSAENGRKRTKTLGKTWPPTG